MAKTQAEKDATKKAALEARAAEQLAADTAAAEEAGLTLDEYLASKEAPKVTTSEKKTLTVEVTTGPQKGLVRTFEKGEEEAAESFKTKFNGQYI